MKEYIKVENGKGQIGIGLNCLLFDDQGYSVIYAPSLNISSYGSNLEEAQEMFKVVIDDFCDNFYTLSEAERTAEVKKYGWHRNPFLG